MTEPGAGRAGWLAAAFVVAIVAIAFAGVSVGQCRDSSDPALSVCESGPVLGVPGTWLLCILAAAFIEFALYRAFRRR